MAFPTSLSSAAKKAAPLPERERRPAVAAPISGQKNASSQPAPFVAPDQIKLSETALLWRKQAALEAVQSNLQGQLDKVTDAWKAAESYLQYRDEVTEALNALSVRAQARTRDVFEGLLTTLIREVMPEKTDQVRLTSGLRNHKRTLEVDVEVDGHVENVFKDKGGAYKNLISMGLRFIVLSRSANRRFLVFDEADCWLSPKHIPTVARLVYELSHRIGVQVIYISHHDSDFFKGLAKTVNLSIQDGAIMADVGEEPPLPEFKADIDQDENAELTEGLGLEYIRLVNFKGHESTLIPLSPRVTVISGQNDIGKSAVIQAVECVIENAGRTGVIRRGMPSCEVEIGLEGGMSLSWQYRRTGAKKTRYTLTSPTGEVVEQYDRATEPPPWINDYLGMAPVGGFNLHLQRQTEPNFLIDDGLPSTRRAELLSLGHEAFQIQQMIRLHSEKVDRLRRESNQAQKSMAELKNTMQALADLPRVTGVLNSLDYDRELLSIRCEGQTLLGNAIVALSALSAKKALFDTLDGCKMPERPELADVGPLKEAAERLGKSTKRLQDLSPLAELSIPQAPVLKDTESLVEAGKKLAEAQRRLALFESLPAHGEALKAPELADTHKLGQKIEALAQAALKQRQCHEHLEVARKELAACQEEKSKLVEELGGLCPACDKPMAGEGHHHV